MPTLAEYKTTEKPAWCAGCGDYAVLAALQKALVNLDVQPHNVAVVAGIGCSGRIGNYVNSYNFHVVHGRSLPAAMGIKLANPELTVVAAGGDGDAFAIGMSHFMHSVRRNPDLTYIVMDNHIYGLTKGQASPTSDLGFLTKGQPHGTYERPVHPLQLALGARATFVAQGFSGNVKQLTSLVEQGIRHRGFAFINVISPCVTFNKQNTHDAYRELLTDLDQTPGYDVHNRKGALQSVIEHDDLVTGLIYQEEGTPALDDIIPGYQHTSLYPPTQPLPAEYFAKILERFR